MLLYGEINFVRTQSMGCVSMVSDSAYDTFQTFLNFNITIRFDTKLEFYKLWQPSSDNSRIQ